MMNRREFIKVSAVASLSSLVGGCRPSVRWDRDAYRKTATSRVAILEAKSYQAPLEEIISRGIHLFKLDLKGKRIVLKPNLVEFDPKGVINTHPSVIEAAISSFRSLGAREVVVAEGPGHRRDSEYLLTASGIYDVINEHRVRYVDLNTDDVRRTKLRSSFTNLRRIVSSRNVVQCRSTGFDAEVKNPSLGRCDTFLKKHVRSCSRVGLWLAKKRTPLGRHSRKHLRH